MIALFGAKRCKHCNIQKDILDSSFGINQYDFFDVLKTKNLKMAEELNIDNIPAMLVFDKNGNEVLRKEGIVSADVIFKSLYGNDVIPISNNNINDNGRSILSYAPKYKGNVKVKTYNGIDVCNATVIDVFKTDIRALCETELKAYLSCGGRKDFCWVVEYEKIK